MAEATRSGSGSDTDMAATVASASDRSEVQKRNDRRRRLLGVGLFLLLVGPFLWANRIPKLDTVIEDIEAATGDDTECFQGFCVEPEAADNPGFLARWWEFSTTYMRFVTIGMIFGFLVAGLAETFLLPTIRAGNIGSPGLRGALSGMAVGGAMTLCSACIVPVSSSFRRKGAGVEATVGITQGSATLNIPALIMVITLFTPLMAVSRLGLSLAGVVLVAPIVGWVVRRGRPETIDLNGTDAAPIATLPTIEGVGFTSPAVGAAESSPAREHVAEVGWRELLAVGIPAWLRSSLGFVRRLAPAMILAGFASGLVINWLTPETTERFLGNHLLGIAIAATVGLAINVPLLFEIPLVAGLFALGMGAAPGATLLFAAAAGGPITYWGLKPDLSMRGVAAYISANWVLGATGGLMVLAWTWALW